MQSHPMLRAAIAAAALILLVPSGAGPTLAAEEQTRGLMFRKELPEGRGMMFDFKQDMKVTMWMKNTYISLDMIFIRADGRIHRIAENTEPESTKIIAAGGPVRAVLEVIGGTARKLGIKPGDRVAH